MKRIENEAILASAGSGKTYQLAHRYIKLLACGCTPEHICAMTFSRKAAGEIFESIVQNLCKAAGSKKGAAAVAGEIGMKQQKQGDFLRLLRVLLDNLQNSHVSTLDSFTVSVIRAFPMELGVSTDLSLMDNGGSDARLLRYRVLSRIFNNRYVDLATQHQFHEAFKQATFGREEKRLIEKLDGFIQQHWDNYQLLPDVARWGSEEAVWGKKNPWKSVGEKTLRAAADELIGLLRESAPDTIAGSLEKIVEHMAGHDEHSPWDGQVAQWTLFQQLTGDGAVFRRGKLVLTYNRKEHTLGTREHELFRVLFRHLFGIEIRKALIQSAGIGRILEEYEKQYDPYRRSGLMTFSDAQHMLTSSNTLSGGAHVSRRPGADRLYVDYRLNCALDHWLLDEFQDTSDLQWEVVNNLVEELLQDDSGRKSFFYVGDVKQAIHGWRGGNPHLFRRILEAHQPRIAERGLKTSFRSCQAIIDMINRVFGSLPTAVSESVRKRWEREWEPHDCAAGHVPGTGYAALIEANPTGEKGQCLPEDRYHAVAALLKEIDPIKRGLSTVILMRGHDAARDLVNQLRNECRDMPICHEGPAEVCDNPVAGALLALIRQAAHPGDTYAWNHLLMSPLGDVIRAEGLDRGALAWRVLHEIQAGGFEPVIREWGGRLKLEKNDSFGRKRLGDLVAAAAAFGQSGSRDCGAFLHYIGDHVVEEAGTSGSINIMTIHKAKGISRDVVIVPDLENARATHLDFVMPRDAEDRPAWAARLPFKQVTEVDDVLRTVRDEALAAGEFEELCVLYVALTRARYATYAIVNDRNADTSSAMILKQTLSDDAGRSIDIGGDSFGFIYGNGDPSWFRTAKSPKGGVAAPPPLSKRFAKKSSERRRLVRREPSKQDVFTRNFGQLFGRESSDVMEFGSAIHELLEQVEWAETADVDAIVDGWKPKKAYPGEVKRDVVEQFRNCLASEAVREWLSRPEGDVELWREKRFDLVRGNELISGLFDRVWIGRDGGKPVSAVIVDYKSSMAETEADIDRKAADYRPQMVAYRKALSQILGLPESDIELVLLFTRKQVVRKIG